uniref:Uncharacterized protein n=1 Tax=Anguilla anguilla TaxID=7936 RepID=A0A0E9QCQ7_ANGAN
MVSHIDGHAVLNKRLKYNKLLFVLISTALICVLFCLYLEGKNYSSNKTHKS